MQRMFDDGSVCEPKDPGACAVASSNEYVPPKLN